MNHGPTNAKAAQHGDAGGLLNCDLLGGGVSSEHTQTLRDFQARKLTRRAAISASLALVLAPLAYGEVSR